MDIKVVLPCPNESDEVWELFEPFIYRFIETWRKFPPGCECELVPVLCADDPTGTVSNLFVGLPVEQFELYTGGGADIGAAQFVAQVCDDDDFIVAMTSRCYFHRAGWLNHMWQARLTHGPGLYGCFASRESGVLHLCTRGYAMDAWLWKAYPEQIDSRDYGTFFEVGRDNPHGSLAEWAWGFGTVRVVYWSGARTLADALAPDNIFRRGNQEDCLLWDKHTDAYAQADPQEKARLERMCFEGSIDPIVSKG